MFNNYDAETLKEEYTIKKTKSGLEEAKRLDKKCKLPPLIFTYIFGIIGALVLGLGMCLAMEVLEAGTSFMTAGVIVGLVGIVMVSINYPIYSKWLQSRKEKYSPAILIALNKDKE